MKAALLERLCRMASEPYRRAGRFAWHFARGKLAGDPAFASLLEYGPIRDGAAVLDIGCGQGLLAAWLDAACTLAEQGDWPDDWPPPPRLAHYLGVELNPAEARRARLALAAATSRIVCADMRELTLSPVDVVVLMDVMHYVAPADQRKLLARAHAALRPDGILLLRVGDAGAGWRYRYSALIDTLVCWLRHRRAMPLSGRTLAGWHTLLGELGYAASPLQSRGGPSFANHLLIARKTAGAAVHP
ncbi:class I SAM-dependent methyltransferase [Crenobacter cavernae]|uniref:Class I SAM-dependent methyltransferase n=1 Tax=Crenobacter cavernae TaxID=2290923 RepID=A0ABY0FCM8_9NEIS|nr:class I SAM-dependent methyltransferase [Crenobacter cavernae]RXZ43871.1 class I SAM-dependent methyltransferase [Crenobacter cavernae]